MSDAQGERLERFWQMAQLPVNSDDYNGSLIAAAQIASGIRDGDFNELMIRLCQAITGTQYDADGAGASVALMLGCTNWAAVGSELPAIVLDFTQGRTFTPSWVSTAANVLTVTMPSGVYDVYTYTTTGLVIRSDTGISGSYVAPEAADTINRILFFKLDSVLNLLDLFGADLEWWHKAWEPTGLTLASGLVAAMTDFSGNGQTFSQGNPAQQPPTVTIGSLRGVDFNLPAAALNVGAAGIALAQPFYFMGVTRPVTSPAPNNNRHILADVGGCSWRWNETDLDFQTYPGTADMNGDGQLAVSQAVICYFSDTASWIEINGVRSAPGGAGTAALGGSFVCYGAGGGFGSADNYVGVLFEGALVSGAQSDALIDQASVYLQSIAAQAN